MGSTHHLARASGGRRHHRHRVHGGEDGGGNGSHPSRGLCLEPHRSANACRDAGNRNRIFASGLCPFDRGRICRKHLLDCRILFDCLVDRGRGFHTLSGVKTFTRDQSGKRKPCGDLFHCAIPAASPVCHVVRQEKIYGSRHRSGGVSHGGRRDGCREEAVFSKL